MSWNEQATLSILRIVSPRNITKFIQPDILEGEEGVRSETSS
jgi:hypothetical protein